MNDMFSAIICMQKFTWVIEVKVGQRQVVADSYRPNCTLDL